MTGMHQSMENLNENLEEIERSCLQLLRVSDEIGGELSDKKSLAHPAYHKYLKEAQDLFKKWEDFAKDSHHLYTKAPSDILPRIEDIKKKFDNNMKAIEVRLRYLDPLKQYINLATIQIQKFKHYTAMSKEVDSIKIILQALESQDIEGEGVLEIKEQIRQLLSSHLQE